MSEDEIRISGIDEYILRIGRALFPFKGEKLRFKIMKALLLGPKSQSELHNKLSRDRRISRQAVSKACQRLKDAGLIEEIDPSGRRRDYKITTPGKKLIGFLYEIEKEVQPLMSLSEGQGAEGEGGGGGASR